MIRLYMLTLGQEGIGNHNSVISVMMQIDNNGQVELSAFSKLILTASSAILGAFLTFVLGFVWNIDSTTRDLSGEIRKQNEIVLAQYEVISQQRKEVQKLEGVIRADLVVRISDLKKDVKELKEHACLND